VSDNGAPAGANRPPNRVSLELLVRLWLGILAFGVLNLPLILLADNIGSSLDTSSRTLTQALIFTFSVAAIAAVAGLVLRWRRITAGFLLGYVLMTIVSGGACTLLVQGGSFEGGLLAGFFLYPLAVVLLAIGLGIAGLINSRRRS
jgi:hypothetical protein